jgi:gliding motility-associated-like protein
MLQPQKKHNILNKFIGYIIGFICTICIYNTGTAQVISGVINRYAKVDSILAVDKVRLDNTDNFTNGDTVMIIQMKGASFREDVRLVDFMKGAGRYEVTIINNIDPATKVIVFTSNLINYSDYDAKEGLQLVRVPSYNKTIVKTGGLTCNAWDGAKGGVLALIVNDTLILNDSINVDKKGFRGADYTVNLGICPSTKGLYYYPEYKIDSAGLKGESLVSTAFTGKRGRGKLADAGGGGYGLYSGGGGGGNFGYGGGGGKIYEESCIDPNNNTYSGGEGGELAPDYFGGTSVEYRDRIFLGGGGGAGAGNLVSAGTNGGAGGGIVFIMARYLKTNKKNISSRGENINYTSNTISGGGGGAGGSVLLYVNNFIDSLKVAVPGGNGGTTNFCSGQGGGGGGGFVWISPSSPVSLKLLLSGGLAGNTTLAANICDDIKAYSGGDGKTVSNFYPVVNGFLFNTITGSQTICYGEIPVMLTGSMPTGGDKNYKYQWQKRKKNTSTWTNIAGANSIYYQPSALSDSTEFRRSVKVYEPKLGDSITDLGKFITINVIPEIKNNVIDSDTTVCSGLRSVILRGTSPTGGAGNFTYNWQSNDNVNGWVTASLINNKLNYKADSIKTQYYRRVVYTANNCSSVSDVDTVIILPKITGNTIGTSQTICYNYSPNSLTGIVTLDGGNKPNYIYRWDKSENDSAHWQLAASGILSYYAPGKLTTKTYFRRIVYSGLNNTCKDTSAWVRIKITEAINHSSNFVNFSQIKCKNAIPDAFTGNTPTLPSGGSFVYKYQWEKSINKTKWDSITTLTSLSYQNPALDTTTYFRRIVLHGYLDCCKDTSAPDTVTVQPLIFNNKIKSGQEICQSQTPAPLTQLSGGVGGGDGAVYKYAWEEKNTLVSTWSPANGGNVARDYQPPALTETKYYRRKVSSGVCNSSSDSIKIDVLVSISGNTITGNQEVCRGIAAIDLAGGTPGLSGGEPGIYRYAWEDSISGKKWYSVSSATQSYYSPGVLNDTISIIYFRRIVKSGYYSDCCISKTIASEIRVNELPSGSIIAMDTAICSGKSMKVRVNLTGLAPHFGLTLKGKTDQFTFSNLNANINSLNITPSALKDTLHIESINDSKGCLAKTKTGLAIIRLVTVPKANAGSDNSICGLQYKLHATPSVGAGLWKPETGSARFPSSSSFDSATVVYNTYGVQKLFWCETNEFCSDSDEITLSFYQQPLKPYIGKDTSIYYQFNYSLNAPIPLVGEGHWSATNPDILILNPENPVTQASNMIFGNNEFVWTISNGNCKAVDDTLVVFVDDIKRYSGFSPNGDGVNEEFVIEGLDNALQKKIKILNRWGSIVFSSDNYDNKWKGTNNSGDILPDDTYFYILTVDGTREYKGYIVLKR